MRSDRLSLAPRLLDVHGGHELHGQIPISGYKHALTLLVAAAVALAKPVILRNVPIMTESVVLQRILEQMGAAGQLADGVWELDPRPMRSAPIPARLSGLIHGSLYLVPALLARFGEVQFAGAGGDRIGPADRGGSRPTEQVTAVLERFGATVRTVGGLHATARRLRGCSIDLMDFSTDHQRLRGPRASSATKTALILAAVAEGTTRLRHPVDREATRELGDFLQMCGATVERDGDTWHVRSGEAGRPVTHELVSDSTEIVTFAACAAHVGGELLLTSITGQRTWPAIAPELEFLEQMGVSLSPGRDSLTVRGRAELRPRDLVIECNGFSTDAHPLVAVLLLGANGTSHITDHVWTNRFAYVPLLQDMEGSATVRGNTVSLYRSRLRPPPQPLVPTDSRAAAAAVLAALGVDGTTRIIDAGHLDRSYELLIDKLRRADAVIEVDSSPSAEGT
jgi:UDP-N-acetylglucosamine 1-carboxyvinyltransferase